MEADPKALEAAVDDALIRVLRQGLDRMAFGLALGSGVRSRLLDRDAGGGV